MGAVRITRNRESIGIIAPLALWQPRHLEPEEMLLIAVLHRAVDDMLSDLAIWQQSAENWFWPKRRGEAGRISFVFICRHFDLDPDKIRDTLKRRQPAPRAISVAYDRPTGRQRPGSLYALVLTWAEAQPSEWRTADALHEFRRFSPRSVCEVLRSHYRRGHFERVRTGVYRVRREAVA